MSSEKIKRLLENTAKNKMISGITLRVEKGNREVIFSGGRGNLTDESQYFIASTTKLYTTAMIFKLISENHISLDDKLSKFFAANEISGLNVRGDKDYSSEITIRQLLSHTSGIPDYFSGKDSNGISLEEKLFEGKDEKWDFAKSIEYARTLKSDFIPGQKGKALYSDTNFQLLGKIIELVREKSLGEIFAEEIFKKLNLTKTYLYSDTNDKTPLALRYKNNELHIPLAMSSFGADGSIVSTANECMVFLKAFFSGELFPEKYLEVMQAEYKRIFFPLQYGVGIMKFQLPRIFTLFKRFPPLIGHSGLSGAFAFYCHEKDVFMTGTVNQIAARSKSYELMMKVLDLV